MPSRSGAYSSPLIYAIPPKTIAPEQIAEATSHLRVALLQIEDEIVKEHVSEALKLLEAK